MLSTGVGDYRVTTISSDCDGLQTLEVDGGAKDKLTFSNLAASIRLWQF